LSKEQGIPAGGLGVSDPSRGKGQQLATKVWNLVSYYNQFYIGKSELAEQIRCYKESFAGLW